MAGFMINIESRVNNIPLPNSKCICALLESIVNSIQSIEDANISNGYIKIFAQRQECNQFSINKNINPSPFESFTIEDNGQGFSSKNYNSFFTADSTLKIKKGCRGIGRFLWLKTFEKATIESNFTENGQWYKRNFDFTPQAIDPDNNISKSDFEQSKTKVTLLGFKKIYRDRCTRSLEILAFEIIEHCLIYIFLNKCPKIILSDNLGETIDLNKYYKDNIRKSLNQKHFTFKGTDVSLYHFKILEGANSHRVHFCANNREVCSTNLDEIFPNLQERIQDTPKIGFHYSGYITSNYLDKAVNSSRTGFDFVDYDPFEFENSITYEQKLIEYTKDHIYSYLKEYIDQIDSKKKKRITYFVAHKQPKYKLLLNQSLEVNTDTKSNISNNNSNPSLNQQVVKSDIETNKFDDGIKLK